MNTPSAYVSAARLFAGWLDELAAQLGRPLRIVETGCLRDLAPSAEGSDGWSTLYIARWVAAHPGAIFDSVDLSAASIALADSALEAEGLRRHCLLWQEDSLQFLDALPHVDFAFLDSCDGLEHAMREFLYVRAAGARMIVMDDFETKAAKAFERAEELGYAVERIDRYAIFRRRDV